MTTSTPSLQPHTAPDSCAVKNGFCPNTATASERQIMNLGEKHIFRDINNGGLKIKCPVCKASSDSMFTAFFVAFTVIAFLFPSASKTFFS